jgi:hypothetical protein
MHRQAGDAQPAAVVAASSFDEIDRGRVWDLGFRV